MMRALLVAVYFVFVSSFFTVSIARDDGRYAQSQLKNWFDSLRNKAGDGCCSNADGRRLDDAEWEIKSTGYRVRVDGVWYDVPDEAVLTGKNRAGQAMVWPAIDLEGKTIIRCFFPAALG